MLCVFANIFCFQLMLTSAVCVWVLYIVVFVELSSCILYIDVVIATVNIRIHIVLRVLHFALVLYIFCRVSVCV